MQILRTHARTRCLRAKQSHFISLPLLTINRWWWPNFNGKAKTVSRISLYAFLSWDAKPLFGWVVSTDILDVRLLLFEAVLTSSNIMFFSNSHLFLSLYFVFHFKWIGENSCPGNDSREFSAFVCEIVIFVWCTQTNPIRFYMESIFSYIGWARECVFLCRSIHNSSILLCFRPIFCLTSAFSFLCLSLFLFTPQMDLAAHFER